MNRNSHSENNSIILKGWYKLKHLNRQRNYKTKKIKDKLKILSIYLLKMKKRTPFVKDDYQSILIFMHSLGIGDAIVISGFIAELKKNGKKVSVIAEKKLSFLFNGLIPIDEFFEFNPINFSEFKNTIKSKQFDLIVDFAEMDTTIIRRLRSLLVINYKHALSFNQPKKTIFDTNIIYTENKHISERMIYTLNVLGIDVDNYKYDIHISESIETEVEQFIKNNIKEHKIIIFNPFASLARLSMSHQQISVLLDALDRQEDYKIILFDCNKVINCAKYKNIISNPFDSFMASACLVKNAHFVITVDTSIVHLANAFNKPQLVIYNNRLFNNRFINNIVWGPNCTNAIQVTATDYLNTEEGDNISNMDVGIIINELIRLGIISSLTKQ